VDPDAAVKCFLAYLEHQGLTVSRAEFEQNLYAKIENDKFLNDVPPLLRPEARFDPKRAFQVVMDRLVARVPGEPWRGA